MALSWQTEFHRYRRYFVNIGQFYRQKKVRVYTEIVLSILTTTFFLVFAIKPTLLTITALIKEIKDKKMVTKKLEEKIDSLNIAQKEYLAIEGDLYLVDQALPKDSQIFVLIRQIEVLASKVGVSLGAVQYSSVNLKGDMNEDKLSAVDFKMMLRGDYQDLKKFLLSLANLRRIVQVKGFVFKTSKEEELNLNISAKAFFY